MDDAGVVDEPGEREVAEHGKQLLDVAVERKVGLVHRAPLMLGGERACLVPS